MAAAVVVDGVSALAAEPETPAGKWVKLYTKVEDLPEVLKRPESKATLEDGWIHQGKKPQRIQMAKGLTNYAVRARMKGDAASRSNFNTLILRAQKAGHYKVFVNESQISAVIQAGKKRINLFRTQITSAAEPAETGYLIEAAVVGARIFTRYNEALVSTATDDKFGAGEAFITGAQDVKDVEVMNLDGLSEAEALAALGVDESGKNLRAIAAAPTKMVETAPKPAAIPELEVLKDQFTKLHAERVDQPYAAELGKLNVGYLGGLDRELAAQKAAGQAEVGAGLEAERKLITSGQSLPEDHDQTPPALKKLRVIYRAAHAKIDAQRAANLKLLIEPLTARLQQIEADFTAKNRGAEAKRVSDYRESVSRSLETLEAAAPAPAPAMAAAATAPAATASPSPPGPPSSTAVASGTEVKKYPKADDRKVAEWVLRIGGTIGIREGNSLRNVSKIEALPDGRFDLAEVVLKFSVVNPSKEPVTNLEAVAGLQELVRLETLNIPLREEHLNVLLSMPKLERLDLGYTELTDECVNYFVKMPSLRRLSLYYCKLFTGSQLEKLAALPMKALKFDNCPVADANLEKLAKFKVLDDLQFSNVPITDAAFDALGKLGSLTGLSFKKTSEYPGMDLSASALSKLRNLKKIDTFGWTFSVGLMGSEVEQIAAVFPRISELTIPTQSYSSTEIASLAKLRALKILRILGKGEADSAMLGLLDLPDLQKISLGYNVGITDSGMASIAKHKSILEFTGSELTYVTDEGLLKLAEMKQLKTIDIKNCPKLTAAGFDAFKKARPDVLVKR